MHVTGSGRALWQRIGVRARVMAIYVTLRPCDGLGVLSRPVHAHSNLGCAGIVRTRTDNIKFLAVAYRARARRITLCVTDEHTVALS